MPGSAASEKESEYGSLRAPRAENPSSPVQTITYYSLPKPSTDLHSAPVPGFPDPPRHAVMQFVDSLMLMIRLCSVKYGLEQQLPQAVGACGQVRSWCFRKHQQSALGGAHHQMKRTLVPAEQQIADLQACRRRMLAHDGLQVTHDLLRCEGRRRRVELHLRRWVSYGQRRDARRRSACVSCCNTSSLVLAICAWSFRVPYLPTLAHVSLRADQVCCGRVSSDSVSVRCHSSTHDASEAPRLPAWNRCCVMAPQR